MVKRAQDVMDRRRVIVTVNPPALVSTNEVYRSMGEAFSKLLGTYSTEELEFLVRYQQAAIEITKQEIATLTHRGAKSSV